MTSPRGPSRAESIGAAAGTPGALTAAAVVMAIGVIAFSAIGLLRAVLTPSPASAATDLSSLDSRASAWASRVQGEYLDQVKGRSLFVTPSAPAPPPPPRIETPRDDSPPPPPSRYGGPPLIGMFNGQAWFGDGTHIGPGDPEQSGVRVIDLNPPWSATLEWRGVEFVVVLFSRDRVVLPPQEAAPPSNP